MTGVVLLIVAIIVVLAAAGATVVRRRRIEASRRWHEIEPVRKLAFEDVTALGAELQAFDSETAGHELDEGARADYQRALDDYESAKTAADRIEEPDDIRDITRIIDDGRYAMACVRARVQGDALPTRRPPCFFDPRHGMSVEDVPFTPVGGVERDVPACALDAERVAAGAEPHVRSVLIGTRRVPYWRGGRAYEPYADGYFGALATNNVLFAGLMFGALSGYGHDYGGYDGGGGGYDGGGGGYDGGGGDYGGDGGGWLDGGGGFDGGF